MERQTEIKLQRVPDVKKAGLWAQNEIMKAKKEGRKLAIEINLTNVYTFQDDSTLLKLDRTKLLEEINEPADILANILKDKTKNKSIDLGNSLKLLHP